jgi:hypothetical protein
VSKKVIDQEGVVVRVWTSLTMASSELGGRSPSRTQFRNEKAWDTAFSTETSAVFPLKIECDMTSGKPPFLITPSAFLLPYKFAKLRVAGSPVGRSLEKMEHGPEQFSTVM